MSEFVLLDSKNLQVASVDSFMEAIGYVRNDGQYHVLHRFLCPDKLVVSFRTAIELHNGTRDDWRFGKFVPPFDNFSFYDVRKANAAKIVESAHLQWSKKEKRIIVTQQLVKFVHPELYPLFKGLLK